MTNDYGAAHWSSKKTFERRARTRKASDNNTPYMESFRYGEDERNYMELIRKHLLENDEDTDYHNNSMLLRRIIKMAYAFVLNNRKDKMESHELAKEEKTHNSK